MNGQSGMERHLAGYESATTVMSSELDTTSFCDSEEDDTISRFSGSTEQSTASRLLKRHRRRRKQRPPRLERVLHIYFFFFLLKTLQVRNGPFCVGIYCSFTVFIPCLVSGVVVQQCDRLHHVSEHHYRHTQHGSVTSLFPSNVSLLFLPLPSVSLTFSLTVMLLHVILYLEPNVYLTSTLPHPFCKKNSFLKWPRNPSLVKSAWSCNSSHSVT